MKPDWPFSRPWRWLWRQWNDDDKSFRRRHYYNIWDRELDSFGSDDHTVHTRWQNVRPFCDHCWPVRKSVCYTIDRRRRHDFYSNSNSSQWHFHHSRSDPPYDIYILEDNKSNRPTSTDYEILHETKELNSRPEHWKYSETMKQCKSYSAVLSEWDNFIKIRVAESQISQYTLC